MARTLSAVSVLAAALTVGLGLFLISRPKDPGEAAATLGADTRSRASDLPLGADPAARANDRQPQTEPLSAEKPGPERSAAATTEEPPGEVPKLGQGPVGVGLEVLGDPQASPDAGVTATLEEEIARLNGSLEAKYADSDLATLKGSYDALRDLADAGRTGDLKTSKEALAEIEREIGWLKEKIASLEDG